MSIVRLTMRDVDKNWDSRHGMRKLKSFGQSF